jgi:hypothetical protein
VGGQRYYGVTMANPTSQRNWREIVEQADGETFHFESLYPYVYFFSGEVRKRDSGPSGGPYDQP